MNLLSNAQFLDKTLLAVASVAEQSIFSEQYAKKRGALQALDVRMKLVTFLLILIVVSMARTPQVLWLLYGLSLILAALSRIPLPFFLKRVWLFVPLFSAAIVLPALLNVVTPGEPILILAKLSRSHTWGPYTIPSEIAVTRQGLWGAIVFVSRVAASVSFAVLFTLTNRWAEIFAGLRALSVPRVFVMTLSMTERYLFFLTRLIQDMYRGRLSRTIRPFAPSVERNWTASRIGFTFRKSIETGDDVYRAMLSRGFHGEYRTVDRFHAAAVDYLWLAGVIIAGASLLLLDRGLNR